MVEPQEAVNLALAAMQDLNNDSIKLSVNAKGQIQPEIKIKVKDLTDPAQREAAMAALGDTANKLKMRFNNIIGI